MKNIYIPMMLSLVMLTACTIQLTKEDEAKQNEVTKTFDLRDFNEISIAGSAELNFTQDSVYLVEVKSTEQNMERLKLEVRQGVLSVSHDNKKNGKDNRITLKSFMNGGHYKLTVHAPSLNAIKIAGSADVRTGNITTENFRIEIAGSGDVNIGGLQARTFDVAIAGSGDVDAKAKNVEYTSFSIAGSGDIDAHFTDCGTVTTSVAGSGDIKLEGNIKKLEGATKNINITNLIIK